METSDVLALRVAVGTTNPCKIKAVEDALRSIIQNNNADRVTFVVKGYDVDSGVSSQPWNDEETKLGAMNRARNAFCYHKHQGDQVSDIMIEPQPHIAVGIEGGLEWSNIVDQSEPMLKHDKQVYCMAWIAIYGVRTPLTSRIFGSFAFSESTGVNNCTRNVESDPTIIFGLSKTATFRLPPSLSKLIGQGIELGRADDMLFNRTNSKHSSGTVGLLTNSLIDRSSYYEQAIILALIPWMQPTLYSDCNYD